MLTDKESSHTNRLLIESRGCRIVTATALPFLIAFIAFKDE